MDPDTLLNNISLKINEIRESDLVFEKLLDGIVLDLCEDVENLYRWRANGGFDPNWPKAYHEFDEPEDNRSI